MGKKKKSLKFKLLVPVISCIGTIVIIFGIITGVLCYKSTIHGLNESMSAVLNLAEESIAHELIGVKAVVKEIANNQIICNSETKPEELITFLTRKAEEQGYINGYTISKSGICNQNGVSYSDSDFFKASINGETYITSPNIDSETGKLVNIISTPIWVNGVVGSEVKGVVAFTLPQSRINSTIENLHISDNGEAYIIDKNGYTIADSNVQLVRDKENIEEESKSDSEMLSLAKIHSKARNSETDIVDYFWEGEKELVAYTPIEETNGWSVCIAATESDFTSGVTTSIYFSIGLMILFIALGTVASIVCSNKFINPITTFIKRIEDLAEGDVVSALPPIKATSYEMQSLQHSLESTLENTGSIIKDIDYILTEMADGNFDVVSRIPEKYIGDYQHILIALNRIKSSLNKSFLGILKVAEQVSTDSTQVSDGALSLAQGTTEQASSIEELSASIAEVTQQIKENAEKTEKAKALTEDAGKIMQGSLAEMQHARQAMEEISSASKDIHKVIKAIDDIAFQTNILALNAAIEAASAGEAGKGFAVVASEVRNLSQKSAQAAKNTTALIESSISAVERGSSLVNKTSDDFTIVSENASKVAVLVEEISNHAQQQAAAVSQISVGIDQVSSVVQTNSATSEESAAASQELSSQAMVLNSLANQFKLADSNHSN